MAYIDQKVLSELEEKIKGYEAAVDDFRKSTQKLKACIKAANRDDFKEMHMARLIDDMINACSEADQLKFVLTLAYDKKEEVSKVLGEEWAVLAKEALEWNTPSKIKDQVKNTLAKLVEENTVQVKEDNHVVVNRVFNAISARHKSQKK
jgi:hypothetical protein